MYNYIFSPLYGQNKWLHVFLGFTLNYTLYLAVAIIAFYSVEAITCLNTTL